MPTPDDKLVARVLRLLTIDRPSGYTNFGDKFITVAGLRTASELRMLADDLDPPEDRATRIAKRLLAGYAGSGTAQEFYERILREEGV